MSTGQFGVRLSGWLTVTNTGLYHFAISADSQAAFFLSTSEDPANARLIVAEPDWSASRDWSATARRIGHPNNTFFPTLTDVPINRSEFTVHYPPRANSVISNVITRP